MKDFESDLLHAAELIAGADALVIAAGAGMGVDSGLPDFRGNEGFWQAYPALAKANLNFSEVASPSTFEQDPSLAWGFYGHRLALYRKTVPHSGFEILRRWGQRMLLGARIFTSNVDGQFQKAGFSEEEIHECHGSIHHMQCVNLCCKAVWRADSFEPIVDVERCLLLNDKPTCPYCGGLARPNVVMFNDWDWLEQREELQAARMEGWLSSISRPVVVEIGAGSAIPSVRHFSHRMIHEFGGRLVRINPREFSVPTSFDIGLPSGAAHALAEIDRVMQGARQFG